MATPHRFLPQLALLLCSGLTLVVPHLARAQGTIAVAIGQASPGSVAAAPVSIELPAGQQVVTLQFNVTVVPAGTAPVLETAVEFIHDLAPPRQGPNFNTNEDVAIVLVAWLQAITPALTGTTAIGTVNVPIPATAQPGDLYRIEILNPSGASDLITEVAFTAVNGEIRVVPETPSCTGDCDDDKRVVVNELVLGVRIILDEAELGDCPAFNASGETDATVAELLLGVQNALQGCP